MAVRQSRGESQTMMKANSRRATKHHTPPPLHQGPSKENYNNTAFSFLINEDCYLVGGRASCKGSWMIGKHQTEIVYVCVYYEYLCLHVHMYAGCDCMNPTVWHTCVRVRFCCLLGQLVAFSK